MENLKKSFQEQILQNFKNEIFLFLKIFLAITLLLSWFLFWRIYENWNLLNKKDWFTYLEIKKISEKWIEWKINFWSLKILKDWKNFSFDSGKFFLENK